MSTEDEPEDELGGEPGDEIDLERAQRLAWRTLRPDQSVDALLADADAAEAEAQEEASARDSEGIKKWRRESREKSEALATAIERAWAIGDPALQAQSIGWLVRQAGALQFGLAVMGHHFPVESV